MRRDLVTYDMPFQPCLWILTAVVIPRYSFPELVAKVFVCCHIFFHISHPVWMLFPALSVSLMANLLLWILQAADFVFYRLWTFLSLKIKTPALRQLAPRSIFLQKFHSNPELQGEYDVLTKPRLDNKYCKMCNVLYNVRCSDWKDMLRNLLVLILGQDEWKYHFPLFIDLW